MTITFDHTFDYSLALKRFCNCKKYFQNGSRHLADDLMGDSLQALENFYRCAKITRRILEERLNVRPEDISKAREEIHGDENEQIYSLKCEILAIFNRFKDKFGKELEGFKSIVQLNMLRREVHGTRSFPAKEILVKFKEDLDRLLQITSRELFRLPLKLVDYHLLIENDQIRKIMIRCVERIVGENYKEAIKKCALAFSISLEDQRQRLNYLLERKELSTALFFLDSPETLYYKLQDYSFILMALQVDINKYKKFEKIVPTTMISDDEREGVSITISDFVPEQWITMESATYCLNFVSETVIMWENMELGRSDRGLEF